MKKLRSIKEVKEIIGLLTSVHAKLNLSVSPDDEVFEDSDGLITFVNMQSSFITSDPEYKVGKKLCDKITNFYVAFRPAMFEALNSGQILPLSGDKMPTDQWSISVSNQLTQIIYDTGALGSFKQETENYSETQNITEFSTDTFKIMLSALTLPGDLTGSLVKFMEGIGKTLSKTWSKKSKDYSTALQGQMHEAIPVSQKKDFYVYAPKIQYIYVGMNSSQEEFRNGCQDKKEVSFDFKYNRMVALLTSEALDENSEVYKDLIDTLDAARHVSLESAKNKIDILSKIKSDAEKPKEDVIEALEQPEIVV